MHLKRAWERENWKKEASKALKLSQRFRIENAWQASKVTHLQYFHLQTLKTMPSFFAPIFHSEGAFPYTLSLKQYRWPDFFPTFLAQLTHYLTTAKLWKSLYSRISLQCANLIPMLFPESPYLNAAMPSCKVLSFLFSFLANSMFTYNQMGTGIRTQQYKNDYKLLRLWNRLEKV